MVTPATVMLRVCSFGQHCALSVRPKAVSTGLGDLLGVTVLSIQVWPRANVPVADAKGLVLDLAAWEITLELGPESTILQGHHPLKSIHALEAALDKPGIATPGVDDQGVVVRGNRHIEQVLDLHIGRHCGVQPRRLRLCRAARRLEVPESGAQRATGLRYSLPVEGKGVLCRGNRDRSLLLYRRCPGETEEQVAQDPEHEPPCHVDLVFRLGKGCGGSRVYVQRTAAGTEWQLTQGRNLPPANLLKLHGRILLLLYTRQLALAAPADVIETMRRRFR